MPALESHYRALVSGQSRGLGSALGRLLLRIAETPYASVMRWRNRRYDRDPRSVTRVAVPVISVGNLTLGGTGKTPIVEWLASWFRRHDVRVAIVSRGYGSSHAGRNDEALELEQRLPDVPHLQNPDRAAAAQVAIEELATQLIVLDDGFQHRRLARDLDVVLLDALEPFGFGHVFPRGLLREPIDSLARADVVILSRADMVAVERRREIQATVQQFAPQAIWAEASHAPQHLLSADGVEEALASLAGQRVAAFCGLGNPAGFRHTLAALGVELVAWREFPDHHAYQRDDIDSLVAWAAQARVERVICTHKDLVKISGERLGAIPLRALIVGAELLAGQSQLESRLAALQIPAPNV